MREGTNGAARPFQHFETNAMPVIGNLSSWARAGARHSAQHAKGSHQRSKWHYRRSGIDSCHRVRRSCSRSRSCEPMWRRQNQHERWQSRHPPGM